MRYYRRTNNMQGSVMTHLHRLAPIIFCAGVLAGCGGSNSEPQEPPKVEDTAFGDMVGTMDKARGVQDTVDAQKQQTDQQINAAEGQ